MKSTLLTVPVLVIVLLSSCLGYGRISIHEGPADTNATVGNIVPCYCKYTGTEDLPLWAINGVIHSPSDLPRGYMVNKTGLYFQAFQEMHMSTYQCLFNIFSASTQSVETIPSTIGTVFVMQDYAPSAECNTRFVEVFIESPTIHLQWEPVNTSAPECSGDVRYCVSYRCCSDSTFQHRRCTANTSIEFQQNVIRCDHDVEKEVVFSVLVERGMRAIVTVNLQSKTEIIVDIVGAVIEIQAQGKCDTLNGIFCIAPGGSNAECYDLGNVPDQMRLEELNYIYNCCSNANEDMKLCLRTTVRSAMNNTLYTRVCDRSLCDISATPCVAATSKLIVAAPPSQPARPCVYYNGTHIVLCAELPFSHLEITGITIQATTTCDGPYQYGIMTTDLCEPIPVSNIVNMTQDCQPTNFSIIANSDAGASQPSPSATVDIDEHTRDFCPCIAENIPAGVVNYSGQIGSSVEFEILQPTKPRPEALHINLCNGMFVVTITATNGSSNAFKPMWNMSTCDFENGQANVSLNVYDFPDSAAADENYTVAFNISLQVDGVDNYCYLYLEVDNVTVSQESPSHNTPTSSSTVGITVGIAVGIAFGVLGGVIIFILTPLAICIVGCYMRVKKQQLQTDNGKPSSTGGVKGTYTPTETQEEKHPHQSQRENTLIQNK